MSLEGTRTPHWFVLKSLLIPSRARACRDNSKRVVPLISCDSPSIPFMENGIVLKRRVPVSPLKPLKVRDPSGENWVLNPMLARFWAALAIQSVPWTVELQPTDVGLGWFSRLYNVLEYRCITPKTRPGIVPVEMPRT